MQADKSACAEKNNSNMHYTVLTDLIKPCLCV